MTRKGITENNAKKLALVKKFKEKREILREKIKDRSLAFEDKIKFVNELAALPANGSHTRYRRRCALTGRGNGNYRHFGICHIQIRQLAMFIPGLTKASW